MTKAAVFVCGAYYLHERSYEIVSVCLPLSMIIQKIMRFFGGAVTEKAMD